MDKFETLALLRNAIILAEDDKQFVEETISFIENTPEFWSARSKDGHLTASAWIVTEDGSEALLLNNAKFNLWLPAGGHGEDNDASIEANARREGGEETGLKKLKLVNPRILDVDVHPIREKNGIPAHKHYDVRFIYSVDAETAAQVVLDAESSGYQWVNTLDLAKSEVSRSNQRMALKTIDLFGLNFDALSVGM